MKDKKPEAHYLFDQVDSFGWISILLHWIGAALMTTLWIIGQNISTLPADEMLIQRELHVSIAVSVWLILLIRILWRVKSKHPKAAGQSKLAHLTAKSAHYAMLLTLAVMLISGPLMLWARAIPINLYGVIPFPTAETYYPFLAETAHSAHKTSGTILSLLVLAHVIGYFKHLMFHDDDTVVRMFWPKR